MRHLPRLRLVPVLVWTALAATVGSSQPSAPGGDQPKITAVRHWSQGEVTRIAVEATGEFRFKADRLHTPERLFFDLIGTKPQLGSHDSRGVSTIVLGDQYVKRVRIAETQHDVTRIVFDLDSDVEFVTSQLANPDRLMIELRPVHSAARLVPRLAELPVRRRSDRPTAVLEVPDPPSPFDWSLRFATRGYMGPDPLEHADWARLPVLPRPAVSAKRAAAPKMKPAPLPDITIPARSAGQLAEEIGQPAKPSSQGETLTRVLGLKLGRVVIDAGHGGNDAGTSGSGGLREKDVVLDIAHRLGALLEEKLGSEVIYTRNDDTFIPLSRRTAIANEKKADLFLSIHVNSSPIRSAAGVETYYLSLSGTKSALETARRENAGSDRNIGELQDLLKQIALKDKVDESKEFADRIQTSLLSLTPRQARAVRDRGVKRAPFVVLIGASMPSVLAEVGFISNSQDEGQMRRPEHRQKIAEALFRGVAAYSNSLSHFQVAQQSGRNLVKSAEQAAQ